MAKQKKEQIPVSKSSPQAKSWLTGKRPYFIIVFIFSFALYFNTLFNGYNLDDELVTNNHQVTSKGWDVLKFNFDAFNSVELKDSAFSQKLKYFLPVVFRVPYYQDKAGFKYEYRPMVFASFALEHMLFSQKNIVNGTEVETDSPTVSHFINIILYALLCSLLFYVLTRLLKNYNILFSFLITLLFAAYPMHTEVVASIKNRDEILALIFGLLSLNTAITFIESRKPIYLVPVLVFFMAGILSKPTTITFALLIPLCLIVFTNPGYSRLLLVSVFLILPAVFYSRVYSAVQQISLAVLLFGGVTGLYIIKNRTEVLNRFRSFFTSLLNYFKKPGSNDQTTANAIDLNILKRPLSIALFLFGAAIPCCISAAGILVQDPWVSCLSLLLTSIIYLVVNDELKLVFTIPITLVTLLAMIKFPLHSGLIETALIVFLASHIFSAQKQFRVVGIICYVIFGAVSAVCIHSFHFLLLVVFVGLLDKRIFAVTLVIAGASAILFVKKIFLLFHGNKDAGIIVLFPVFYGFIFLLWKGKWKWSLNTAAIIIALSLVFYFLWAHPAGNSSTYLTAQRIYYNLNSIKAADPTPVQSARPLNYPEYPLNNNDPFSLKAGTSLEILGNYLRMVMVPYPMSFYYGYSYITPEKVSDFIPLLSLLIHFMLLVVAIYFFRKIPILSFAILFYLISIAVFSNIITPIPGMIADRFLLIPSIGFCIGATYLLSKIFKQDFSQTNLTFSSIKQPLKISLAIILIMYSGLTFSRNFQWKDQVTLFRHDITVVENSAQAQNLLAVHLFLLSNRETDHTLQKQLREEAIPHFKKALEIYPDFLNPSYDLGRIYEVLNLPDQAFAQYQHTIKIDTGFYMPYFNMATLLHNKGDYAGAIPLYQKFLIKYPKQLEAYTNLSFAYFQLKDFEKSIAINRDAIVATGTPFYPTVNIAKTYTVMGQLDSALFYFEQAHIIMPNDGGVNLNIQKLKQGKP